MKNSENKTLRPREHTGAAQLLGLGYNSTLAAPEVTSRVPYFAIWIVASIATLVT